MTEAPARPLNTDPVDRGSQSADVKWELEPIASAVLLECPQAEDLMGVFNGYHDWPASAEGEYEETSPRIK